MASVIETYEQQLAASTADITLWTSKIPNLTGAEKTKAILTVERHIEECNEFLEQMELEVKQLQSSDRPKYERRLKSYQTEMSRLQKDLKAAKMAYRDDVDAREELLGDDSADQRTRLLDNTERLERSSRKLDTGYRLAVETEHIGAEILNNLHSQRATIQHGRERLRETDSDLGKSSRILSGMMRRILQNRVILYVVGGVMVIIIIVTIYLIASR